MSRTKIQEEARALQKRLGCRYTTALASVKAQRDCECWEGCNDREGKAPCEHERLFEKAPFTANSSEPGMCRCGAMGPPWKHKKGCAHD